MLSRKTVLAVLQLGFLSVTFKSFNKSQQVVDHVSDSDTQKMSFPVTYLLNEIKNNLVLTTPSPEA